MLSVTHQWTIHHALTINPHDASLFAIQPEQGNAITQKIRWVVLAKAVLRAGTLTDLCRRRGSVRSLPSDVQLDALPSSADSTTRSGNTAMN